MTKFEKGINIQRIGYGLLRKHHKICGLGFGIAIEALKQGKVVTKQSWHKSGMYLELQKPDRYSKMTAPYIYITIDNNYRIPWHPSQADVLEEDWVIIE